MLACNVHVILCLFRKTYRTAAVLRGCRARSGARRASVVMVLYEDIVGLEKKERSSYVKGKERGWRLDF